MKLILKITFIFLITFVLGCSPGVKETKSTDTDLSKIEKKQEKLTYWDFMRTHAKLSDGDIKIIQLEINRANKRKISLQKDGKWSGKSNAKNRKSVYSTKSARIKKKLGKTKYAKWKKGIQKWKKRK